VTAASRSGPGSAGAAIVTAGPVPIGVSLSTIGVGPEWWLDAVRRLEAAGYSAVWVWDHHLARADGRGRARSVLEAWTMLTAGAMATSRIALGSHVLNVMNRHPALLARMAATLQVLSGGRLVLGLGIGGNPLDHEPLGIPLPSVEERLARLEETIAVLRALWSGRPVELEGRFVRLRQAVIAPVPDPPPPIVVAGQSSRGARLAARIGDGWTTPADRFERLRPVFEAGLLDAGRARSEVTVIVGFEGGRSGVDFLAGSPWIADPVGTWARWRAAGADGVVVSARTEADVVALLTAAERFRRAAG
jgi:alkanesulfonate monooxygenase SsuD/methylene tetrahydromethanopterin reductase-like flavin-dependent oxidoreductase (luciferase family)